MIMSIACSRYPYEYCLMPEQSRSLMTRHKDEQLHSAIQLLSEKLVSKQDLLRLVLYIWRLVRL